MADPRPHMTLTCYNDTDNPDSSAIHWAHSTVNPGEWGLPCSSLFRKRSRSWERLSHPVRIRSQPPSGRGPCSDSHSRMWWCSSRKSGSEAASAVTSRTRAGPTSRAGSIWATSLPSRPVAQCTGDGCGAHERAFPDRRRRHPRLPAQLGHNANTFQIFSSCSIYGISGPAAQSCGSDPSPVRPTGLWRASYLEAGKVPWLTCLVSSAGAP